MASLSWRPIRLGDVVEVEHGWPFKSEYFAEHLTGGPIVVNIGNFRYSGGFRFDTTTTKEYRASYPPEYELRPGDILLVMTCQTAGGEILGIPGRIPHDGRLYLHNQRMGKIVVTRPDLVSDRFLYWLFLSRDFNQALVSTSTGTKILHTAPVRIEAFKFLLPSLDEQKAIARILDAIEDKIETNRRQSATLDAMARALFNSWFVEFDPVVTKASGEPIRMPRDKAALFPDRFINSKIGRIPAGWRVGTVAEIAEINARSVGPGFPHSTIQYIDISSVAEGRLIDSSHMPLSKAPSRAQRLVADGDTIWSCVRPNRRSYLFMHQPAPHVVVSTGFAVLSSRDKTSAYLHLLTTTDEFVDYLTMRAEGSAYPAVRADTFAKAVVLLPSRDVLTHFECIVGPLLRRSHHNEGESSRLTALRDSLLPKLLSGEMRTEQVDRAVEVGND
jgi:type I restriction enzyme S subunit